MRDKFFIDTNIFAYAVDQANKTKQATARKLIATQARKAAISTQVMQEFFVAATRKLNISALKAKELVHKLGGFQCIQITTTLVHQAIDTMILNQISYWDALIVVAAIEAKCNVILTEDMNSGQVISGIEIKNPFTAE